jgi:ligand-binding sensor domain-containing protein
MTIKNSGRIFRNSGIIILLIFLASCKKETYDLMDPAKTGVWTSYKTGLPGNQVRDIALDKNGLMWVAFSGAGLSSFNGSTWTPYNVSNSGLLSNNVTCLDVDKFGSLLVGTTDGISIRSANNQWTYFQDPILTLYVNSIKGTSKGWIVFGTENQGFYINDGTGFVQIYDATFKNVNAIEEDKSGNLWLGTDNGLLKYDGKSFSLLTTANGLPSNNVISLFCDSRSRLWVGTNGGKSVSWIDSGNKIYQVYLFNGSAGTYARDIYEDRRGDIWFATWWDGLIDYDGVVPHAYKTYNGFPENDVNAAGEDKNGNMWFGLYSKGLEKYTLPIQ